MWNNDEKMAMFVEVCEYMNGLKRENKMPEIDFSNTWEKLEKKINNAKENNLSRVASAQKILSNVDMSDDLKLFEVFQLYKKNLRIDNAQLYYALIGWADAHIKELIAEQRVEIHK